MPHLPSRTGAVVRGEGSRPSSFDPVDFQIRPDGRRNEPDPDFSIHGVRAACFRLCDFRSENLTSDQIVRWPELQEALPNPIAGGAIPEAILHRPRQGTGKMRHQRLALFIALLATSCSVLAVTPLFWENFTQETC